MESTLVRFSETFNLPIRCTNPSLGVPGDLQPRFNPLELEAPRIFGSQSYYGTGRRERAEKRSQEGFIVRSGTSRPITFELKPGQAGWGAASELRINYYPASTFLNLLNPQVRFGNRLFLTGPSGKELLYLHVRTDR